MNFLEKIELIDVDAANVAEHGVFCIKDKKAAGFHKKVEWFKEKQNKGLTLKIAIDEKGIQLGFIEYIPSEQAWRPIKAENYLFIQCITVYSKKMRNQGLASHLIKACEQDAIAHKKDGMCTMSSNGSWLAERTVFEKYGFVEAEKKGRFELLYKSFGNMNTPRFLDWTQEQHHYTGWNLIYANQCPWQAKSIHELSESAKANGIDLKIRELKTPKEAQKAPSGFGVFSLINDGELLADHYISKTRFENILKKEKV